MSMSFRVCDSLGTIDLRILAKDPLNLVNESYTPKEN